MIEGVEFACGQSGYILDRRALFGDDACYWLYLPEKLGDLSAVPACGTDVADCGDFYCVSGGELLRAGDCGDCRCECEVWGAGAALLLDRCDPCDGISSPV